ncbi:MBL fold metallo-hydrolase [Halobaculum sp. MBLA0143]|uniref:MBL fold metallo-hydrolase n=1 Tax=Halobaculum sp. MBLA0143 TaxID=3079933 RepID=UPI00352339C5
MNQDDFPTPPVEAETLAPTELKRRIDDGEQVTVLDARSPADFEEWNLGGPGVEVENVPYYEFVGETVDEELLAEVPTGDPLVVLCAKGYASRYVAGELAAAGRAVVGLADGMEGWAEIYERHEVTRYDGPGTLYQYQRPSSGCLGYLLVSDGEAAVIDPLRAFTDRYLADVAASDADLQYALDTHVHADHVSGVRDLSETSETDVTGVIPEAAVPRGITYTGAVTTAADDDRFAVGDAEIEARHTPGHTSGMTSYLVGGSLLATGDGLFVDSVARPDLEEGDDGAPEAARELYETLHERILPSDDDLLIGGAHVGDDATPAADGSYTARLGELVDAMAPLSYDEGRFVDTVLADMPPRPANYEEIIATNLGQRETDDEEAFQLELGPNNCAASQGSLADD